MGGRDIGYQSAYERGSCNVNRMLTELLRWQRQGKTKKSSNRRVEWARSFIERFAVRLVPHSHPAMMLLRPIAPIHLFCYRWQQYALQLSPKINLAVRMEKRNELIRVISNCRQKVYLSQEKDSQTQNVSHMPEIIRYIKHSVYQTYRPVEINRNTSTIN